MPTDARDVLRGDFQQRLKPEYVDLLMNEILAIKKQGSAEIKCKHCGRAGKYSVEIPDAKAVTGALKDLMAEAFGRPDVAQGVDQERIVFERVVYLGGEEKKGVSTSASSDR